MPDPAADRVATPIGDVILVADQGALVYLDFAEFEERRRRVLGQRYGDVQLVYRPNPHGLSAQFLRYFDRDFAALDALPISLAGTPFQQRVWLALRGISPGQTATYGGLAGMLGVPNGARAVGITNGQNPISIVLPCHRVIGANAALTGYAGGLERKRWLLRHEGAAFEGA
jgi:methylated-DNA-[protein]-cysteine S-methyltransferase